MVLKLSLGKIPLRIHPSFLLTTFILQFDKVQRQNGVSILLIWFAVILVSITIHELGHALMGKAFGLEPEMDLHAMGGTTSWARGRKLSRGKSILVSLAGPVAGLVLGGVMIVIGRAMTPTSDPRALDFFQQNSYLGLLMAPTSDPLVFEVFWDSFLVNIIWSGVNLLPILPLDGGNVFREILQASTKGRGEVPARIGSIVVAVAVAVPWYILLHDWWLPLLCALFSVMNFRAVREVYLSKRDESLVEPLESAVEALKDNDGARVVKIAGPIVERAASARMRAEAIHILAYGLLLQRKFEEADAVMRKLPSGFSANPQYAELRAQLAQ